LRATILVQPQSQPRCFTTFDPKDQSGVNLEFKRDAAGKVVEAAFSDNGTTLILKRK